jgi:hypothetical protein
MIKGKLFNEIFDEFQKAETKQDRIAVLKKYDDPRFRLFLFYALDPRIKFDVEVPKYRPAPEPAGLNFTYLSNEVNKMYRFVKDHPKKPSTLKPEKQKQILLVILESLYKEEAEIFVQCIKKEFKLKFLTIKLIEEAYK